MMENEGEEFKDTYEEQHIDQQDGVNENDNGDNGAQDAGNGRPNSDEEEPIKADPTVTDE